MVSTANLLIQTADRFNRQLEKVWAEHPPLCQKKPGILPCDAGKPCPLGLNIVVAFEPRPTLNAFRVESDSERGAMHCPSQAERIPRARSALEGCCQHRKMIKEELIKEII